MTEIVDGVVFDFANLTADIEAIRDMQEVTVECAAQLFTGGSIQNIFSWGDGPILVTALVGEITDTVSADPCDLKLIMDPSVGGDTDICTVIDINGLLGDSYLYIDGVITNAMVNAVDGVALPLGLTTPLILPRGSIDMDLSNSDPSTGEVVWWMRYKPLASGIVVAALT